MYDTYKAYPWSRWMKWGVIGLIILIVLGISGNTYNGLVQAEQKVRSSWSQVENVMRSRADKINNLVETVKGYIKHEEEVFGKVAEARSVLMSNSDDIKDKLKADSELTNATRDILVLVENYPELKASEQFIYLQEAIEGAENRVSVARKDFIEAVEAYNTKVSRFPGNIFARLMGFKPMDYFEADSNAHEVPKVEF